jgi:hypothetical protein
MPLTDGTRLLTRLAAVRTAILDRLTPRVAFLLSLAVWWLNVILTVRWAHVPGSIHGPKRPFFLAALVVLTVLACRQRTWEPVVMPRVWRWTLAAGVLLLCAGFLTWFPPGTWRQMPFLDNWVPRYQSTIEQIALIQRGALVGWNWWFLGGYQLSSDITQSLAIPAFPFVLLFGPQLGFHLLHLVLFGAVPLLVYLDLRSSEDRESAALAAALACLLTAGYSYSAVKSGDTNALAGVSTTTLAVVAMHAAWRGRRYGAPLLAATLALTAYTHLGFFAYAVAYCTLHCVYYRDRRGAVLLAASVACALVAALPLMWENWTLPAFFSLNNVLLNPPESFQWGQFARQFYYNVEILFRPGRWFNDYTTPIRLFLPVAILLAIQARGRVGFHAWAALATLGLLTFNYAEFGFAFSRALHILPVFTAPVLAGFIIRYAGRRPVAAAFVVSLALYVQVVFWTVPHLNSVDQWNGPLAARIAEATNGIVLLENSPHADMIESRAASSPKTPFGVHFEPLLPGRTGRRFYAGFWDGWQWSVFRQNLLAAGTMWGRSLADIPPSDVVRELARWGIQDVFVWSPVAQNFFAGVPDFEKRWEAPGWQHFVRRSADTRQVLTPSGSGTLAAIDPLGARIELRDVDAGAEVIVRTNYYPVWLAYAGSEAIPLFSADGLLAFRAPRSGSYDVHLVYPRRLVLITLSLAGFALGLAALYKVFDVLD